MIECFISHLFIIFASNLNSTTTNHLDFEQIDTRIRNMQVNIEINLVKTLIMKDD